MTGPGTDGFLPLRPGHGVYILGKKVRGMFTWTGAWGQTTRGVVCRSQGPEGGVEEKAPRGGPEGGRAGNLNLSSYTHTHPSTHSPRLSRVCTYKEGLLLPPALHPRLTCLPHLHPWEQREAEGGQHLEGRWAGQSSSWRAGVGGVGGATGPAGWGGPPAHSCSTSGRGPQGTEPGTRPASGKGGQGWVGPSARRLQDGWGPRDGVSPAASAALGASASLFLGINIYRFICRLPYTLGCLPPGKNRAGSPTPTLLLYQGWGQRGPGAACPP